MKDTDKCNQFLAMLFLKTSYSPEFHVIPSGTEDGLSTGNVVKCGLQQYSESWKHAGRIGNKYTAAVESYFSLIRLLSNLFAREKTATLFHLLHESKFNHPDLLEIFVALYARIFTRVVMLQVSHNRNCFHKWREVEYCNVLQLLIVGV